MQPKQQRWFSHLRLAEAAGYNVPSRSNCDGGGHGKLLECVTWQTYKLSERRIQPIFTVDSKIQTHAVKDG
jgi:hypothetical protein